MESNWDIFYFNAIEVFIKHKINVANALISLRFLGKVHENFLLDLINSNRSTHMNELRMKILSKDVSAPDAGKSFITNFCIMCKVAYLWLLSKRFSSAEWFPVLKLSSMKFRNIMKISLTEMLERIQGISAINARSYDFIILVTPFVNAFPGAEGLRYDYFLVQ